MESYKISQLQQAGSITEDDLLEVSVSSDSTYDSAKATVGQIATATMTEFSYDNLSTENKTIIGAINELLESGPSVDPNLILDWDFTKSTGSLHGVTFNSNGANFKTFTSNDNYILIPYAQSDITIELSITQMNCWNGYHRRIVMASPAMGFIYRNSGNGVWAFYSSSGWQNSSLTNGSLFNTECTLGVYIDSQNKWHIYKDGSVIFEPSAALPLISSDGTSLPGEGLGWFIGSSGGNSIPDATIKSLKLYSGNKYST